MTFVLTLHLVWYKAGHRSMCQLFIPNIFFMQFVLEGKPQKHQSLIHCAFRTPSSCFDGAGKSFFQHSLAGHPEIFIYTERIFFTGSLTYFRKYCFCLYAIVLLGK